MTAATVRYGLDGDYEARVLDAVLAFHRDPDSMDWQEFGSCRYADQKIFFPPTREVVDADGNVVDDVEPDYPSDEARAFCGRCPVADVCLSWAIRHRPPNGVWGNTTAYQREQLTRRRERKTCPGCTSTLIISSGREQLCLGCGVGWPA